MISRNKIIIIASSIYVVLFNVIGLIFVLVFDNNDFIPVFNFVGTLLFLLFINIRSSYTLKVKFKEEHFDETKIKKKDKEYFIRRKETQKVCWIIFFIMLAITVISMAVFLSI